jgi:CRP-like cAMP-binding protein
MLTTEELATIPLFSKLPTVELEHVARKAADIHLAAGEYAVHEGEERALFAVLEGKIEVIKRIDGIDRTIGWRVSRKIFGEVPIALGGPFIGSYHGSRTIWAFPTAFPATNSPAGRCNRQGGSGRKFWSRAIPFASIRQPARSTSTATTRFARGRSSSPPA